MTTLKRSTQDHRPITFLESHVRTAAATSSFRPRSREKLFDNDSETLSELRRRWSNSRKYLTNTRASLLSRLPSTTHWSVRLKKQSICEDRDNRNVSETWKNLCLFVKDIKANFVKAIYTQFFDRWSPINVDQFMQITADHFLSEWSVTDQHGVFNHLSLSQRLQ